MTFNIILVGNGGTGKTQFIRSLTGQPFTPYYKATKSCSKHEIEINGRELVLYDLPGQSQFSKKVFGALPKPDGVIFFYSGHSVITIKGLSSWKKTLQIQDDVPFEFVRNFSDITTPIKTARFRSITASSHSVSCKFGTNVICSLNCLIDEIVARKKEIVYALSMLSAIPLDIIKEISYEWL
jgi:GTPase SAR1 family protein